MRSPLVVMCVCLGLLVAGGRSVAQEPNPSGDATTKRLAETSGLFGPHRDTITPGQAAPDESPDDPAAELRKRVSLGDVPHAALIAMPHVRKELEIADFQLEEIANARKRANENYERVAGVYGRATSERERAKLEKDAQRIVDQFQQDVKNIILPHQWKALDAYLYRITIRRTGLFRAITSGPFAERIGVRESQKEELRVEAARLQAELQEKIDNMTRDATQRLLSKLDARQRQELAELVGGNLDDVMPANLLRLVSELESMTAGGSILLIDPARTRSQND